MKTIHRTTIVVAALVLFVLLLGSCSILQEPEAPSAPLEAVPVEVDNTAADEVSEGETNDAAGGATTVFTIDPSASTVSFILDEELRGQPKTVVGTTDQVSGEIAVNLQQPGETQLGVILINARTFVTDSDLRNRAIQNRILNTGQYEFVTFTPTEISGLPDSAAVGDQISFTISGYLTIRDITQPVMFSAVVTIASESQLVGTASTVVDRSAFDLAIPSVRDVANVEEQVELSIEFTANAG